MAIGAAGTERIASRSSTFQALGVDGFSDGASTEGIHLFLDGDIQIDGDPLTDANGPGREFLRAACFRHYQKKNEEFLKDISGGFRLALWDSERQKLLLAVDPFATRPLYYSYVNGLFIFAPRISCFWAVREISREIDPNVLYFYLNHSFVPAPYTVYRHINRLQPGHFLSWQGRRIRIRQYWDIQYEEDRSLTANAAASLLRSAVERSVRSYLDAQKCDMRQIGAFLSGGTDSSTLVGLMTKIGNSRIKTFSVGFAEQHYDEIHYARVAAVRFNADAHECFVNADEALAAVPTLAEQFDEPFGNSSAIPTYFCLRMAREAGVQVMFAGDGGDELFAGNERYLSEKYFCLYDGLPAGLQIWSDRLSALLPEANPWRKVRRYIERAREPNPDRFFHYQLFLCQQADRFFTQEFKRLLKNDFPLEMPRRHYEKVRTAHPLNRLLYMDLKMCIADNDLFKVNRMAEALNMKVCYPYLDRELAEIMGKIPAGLKLKGFQKRYIFKRAFEKLLPQEILSKKKHGFGLPIAHWLRTHSGFREMAHSLLLDPVSLQRGYFTRNALEKLLRQHEEEKSDFYGAFIWNLTMLELWHRKHADKNASRAATS
jgi:asparagine synthase (glutamine-hydrolysing)